MEKTDYILIGKEAQIPIEIKPEGGDGARLAAYSDRIRRRRDTDE